MYCITVAMFDDDLLTTQTALNTIYLSHLNLKTDMFRSFNTSLNFSSRNTSTIEPA